MKFCLSSIVVLFMLLSGCDDKSNDYEGFSELIAERNKARHAMTKSTSQKNKSEKTPVKTQETRKPNTEKANSPASTKTLVKKEVSIIDTSTGRPLAKGRAYLNEQGRIVSLKIHKK